MAISWGAWEYSGGNGMRVGIEVEWTEKSGGPIDHNSVGAKATVKIYTENQYSYSDDQKLSYSGAISGSTSFHNGQGGAVTLRETKTYTYDYGANEYGSSPGSRTFTAKLSGAYNGVTPSKSVTSNIPARPIATPAAPTNVSATYISDGSVKVTWTNKSTAGEPWDEVQIDREEQNDGSWSRKTNAGGGSSSYTDNTTTKDTEYHWRVRAKNSAGTSAWVETNGVWTTPDAPTNAVRTQVGSDQVITWTDNVSHNDHDIEVERANASTGVWTKIATLPEWTETYTDVAPDPATSWKYRVRAVNTLGSPLLVSAYSNETTASAGTTSPPDPPTNLAPAGITISPTVTNVFTWTYNSPDGTGQQMFEIQWRVTGDLTWNSTGGVWSSASSWDAPAYTFPTDATVEWRVRTWSVSGYASEWSSLALFSTALDPSAIRENLRAVMLNTDTGDLETAGRGALPPVGSITMFAGQEAPAGWLMCHGQEVPQAVYPELFAVIGTSFGSASAGNFRLPDMRLRLPIGASDGSVSTVFTLGASDGRTSLTSRSDSHSHHHSHTVNDVGSAHTHTLSLTSPDMNVATNTSTGGSANRITNGQNHTHSGSTANASTDSKHTHGLSSNVGLSNAETSAHSWQALHYIIKT